MPSGVTKQISKEREQIAWRMRVQDNKTEAEIAAHLGVSQPAVSLILSRVRKRGQESLTDSVRENIALQYDRLELTRVESMLAWEASKKPRYKTRRRERKDGQITETVAAIEREGNPKYLDCALRAMAEQRELLGIIGAKPPMKPKDPMAELADKQKLSHAVLEKMSVFIEVNKKTCSRAVSV